MNSFPPIFRGKPQIPAPRNNDLAAGYRPGFLPVRTEIICQEDSCVAQRFDAVVPAAKLPINPPKLSNIGKLRLRYANPPLDRTWCVPD